MTKTCLKLSLVAISALLISSCATQPTTSTTTTRTTTYQSDANGLAAAIH